LDIDAFKENDLKFIYKIAVLNTVSSSGVEVIKGKFI
jgi:hypothetical protein